MSLTAKRQVTEKKLAANRRNGARSRGPVTSRGRAHSAAANLRHGYYSQAAQVALAALGEDPAEFKRRLDSLVRNYEPADALEMGLVMQMLRAQWRMERFHRLGESLAVKHLQEARKKQQLKDAIFCMPLIEKMERLEGLYDAACLDMEDFVGPEAMQVFEKCRGDLPAEKSKVVLELLLRLRKPGAGEELGPAAKRPDLDGTIPAAEGEERKAAQRELGAVLAGEIGPLQKRIMGDQPDEAQAQFDRDQMLAQAQPQAGLMNRAEESSLRQLWRTTNLLMKIQKERKKQKEVKMKGDPN
jgi:hypothetical protein